jgi:hypothetical protein
MPTLWKKSSMAHKTTIQFGNNTYLPFTKTSPTNAKGILPSHHNNIDGKLLTTIRYNLHMGNFAKYLLVVQTCAQQVVGG